MTKLKRTLTVCLCSMLFIGCNITKKMGQGDTPLPRHPTHVEFWNGGTCIGSYDNATISIASVMNSVLLGADITWYYYEICVNGQVVDTIVDSESLAIKYTGSRN